MSLPGSKTTRSYQNGTDPPAWLSWHLINLPNLFPSGILLFLPSRSLPISTVKPQCQYSQLEYHPSSCLLVKRKLRFYEAFPIIGVHITISFLWISSLLHTWFNIQLFLIDFICVSLVFPSWTVSIPWEYLRKLRKCLYPHKAYSSAGETKFLNNRTINIQVSDSMWRQQEPCWEHKTRSQENLAVALVRCSWGHPSASSGLFFIIHRRHLS